MKIPALIGNPQGMSIWTEVDIPMIGGEKGRSASGKLNAVGLSLATNQPNEDKPVGKITTGGDDLHVPRIIVVTNGHAQLQVGTGETRRFGTGEWFFVYGKGGHIATAMKPWPRSTLSITMSGTGLLK